LNYIKNHHFFKTYPVKKDYKWLLWSIGLVYLWFGLLKFFPHASPAEILAKDTIAFITFGLIPTQVGYVILAIWEVLIGILFFIKKTSRAIIWLALVHMICTFIPLFIFIGVCFHAAPFIFTIVGQYIIKNIIITAVLVMLLKNLKTYE